MSKNRIPLLAAALAAAVVITLLAAAVSGPRVARRSVNQTVPASEAVRLAGGAALDGIDIVRLRFQSRRSAERSSLRPWQVGDHEITLPDTRVEMDFEAELEMRVYREDLFGVRVLTARAVARVGDAPARPIDLADDMGREVLVVTGPDLRIHGVVFPADLGAGPKRAWRQILACFQRTYGGDRDRWQATERDETGTYTARYQRVSALGAVPLVIERTSGDYDQVASNGRLTDQRAEASGATRFVLDPLPVTIEGHRRIRTELKASGQGIEAAMTFRIERTGIERDVALTAPAFDPADAVRLESPVAPDRLADGRRRYQALVERVDALARSGKRFTSDMHALIGGAVELFKLSDEAARAVVEYPGNDDAAGLVLGALGAAGTPTCQEALCSIVDDRSRSLRVRRDALIAMARLRHPGPEIDAALRRVRESEPELAGTAGLVLAGVGRDVRSESPERFHRIEAEVLADLAQAKTDEDLGLALEMAGNLGPRKVPEQVLRALVHRTTYVRVSAVRAMGLIDDPEVDLRLRDALRLDPDAEVRRVAVDVILFRVQNGLAKLPNALLKSVAANDEDTAVRKRAATTIKAAANEA